MDLERRVQYLEQRVANLEKALATSQESQKTAAINNTTSVNNTVTTNNTAPVYTTQAPNKPILPYPQSVPKQTVKRDSDVEAFIGKKVSVIIASALIFIGVIVFASALLPYLTQEIKFVLMCLASVGFAAVSYILVRKKQNNLSISLLACSLGTVYITLFTGNLYFKLINTVILYIALLLWTMVIYYCSRYKSLLFNIIGQAGIIISLILCVSDAMLKNKPEFILYALIFIVISEITYNLLFKAYLINMISILLSVIILSFPIIYRFEESVANSFLPFDIKRITVQELFSNLGMQTVAFAILVCLFLFVLIRNVVSLKSSKISQIEYSVINLGGIIAFFGILQKFDWPGSSGAVVFMIYAGIIFVITEGLLFSEKRHILTNILSGILIGMTMLAYIEIFETLWVSCLILLVPLIIYVHKTETTFNKMVVSICFIIATIFNIIYLADYSPTFWIKNTDLLGDVNYIQAPEEYAILCLSSVVFYLSCLFISLFGYFTIKNRYQNLKTISKIFLYLVILSNTYLIFCGMNQYYSWQYTREVFNHADEWLDILNNLIALIVQVLFWRSSLIDKNTKLTKQPLFIVYSIVNAIMMFACFFKIYSIDDYMPTYIVLALITVALSTFNIMALFSSESIILTVYAGIKVAFMITVIMHAVDFKPLVSVVLFIWAVLCIIFGMKLNQKGLRIYALVLALLSTVKLVMIDISYGNSLGRAFSFIVCGILCFGISYIYHSLEKKQPKNSIKENNNEM